MAPLWNHGAIASRASENNKKGIVGKCTKTILSVEEVLGAHGASAHAETIGNVSGFAHAKYGATP